jgi:hypothetical protein
MPAGSGIQTYLFMYQGYLLFLQEQIKDIIIIQRNAPSHKQANTQRHTHTHTHLLLPCHTIYKYIYVHECLILSVCVCVCLCVCACVFVSECVCAENSLQVKRQNQKKLQVWSCQSFKP